jgi:hypothetical protein
MQILSYFRRQESTRRDRTKAAQKLAWCCRQYRPKKDSRDCEFGPGIQARRRGISVCAQPGGIVARCMLYREVSWKHVILSGRSVATHDWRLATTSARACPPSCSPKRSRPSKWVRCGSAPRTASSSRVTTASSPSRQRYRRFR